MNRTHRTERDRKREATRERLYDAALDVFRRDGVDRARVDDIARAAGVSRATFYFHFPSKDDVLLRRLSVSQTHISAELAALPPSATLREVLQRCAREIATEWQDDPALLREIGTVALKMTAQNLPEATHQHPVQLALIPRFDAALERGEIGHLIPPELMTEFFLVNLFGAALNWVGAPLAPLELILLSVVDFFLRAAGTEPLPEPSAE